VYTPRPNWEAAALKYGPPLADSPTLFESMKLKIRNSNSKRSKKNGFRTRQKTANGRKINKRQRARHGAI